MWKTLGMQTPDPGTPSSEPDDVTKFDWNGRRPIEIIARWLIKGPLIVINLLTGGGGYGSDR
jgi:hypothetical protein